MSTVTPAYQPLKYRPLPAFVNRELHIPTFYAIQSVVLRELSSVLPAQFTLQSKLDWMAMVMAKYGALDLTFAASAPVLTETDAITWERLRDLGLAEEQASLADEFEWVERTISETQCFLRVFLTCYLPSQAMQLRDEQARIEMARGVPASQSSSAALDYLAANITQRFPLNATMDDACLTNSSSIWVNAHFYL